MMARMIFSVKVARHRKRCGKELALAIGRLCEQRGVFGLGVSFRPHSTDARGRNRVLPGCRRGRTRNSKAPAAGFNYTHPCEERKDGAPFVFVVPAKSKARAATRTDRS